MTLNNATAAPYTHTHTHSTAQRVLNVFHVLFVGRSILLPVFQWAPKANMGTLNATFIHTAIYRFRSSLYVEIRVQDDKLLCRSGRKKIYFQYR